MKYIKKFKDLRIGDIGLVGGKNASLGQMIAELADKGIVIPHGFAITAKAYWYFIEHNQLLDQLKEIMSQLTDMEDIKTLQKVGKEIRSLIERGQMPEDLAHEITTAYRELSEEYHQKDLDVAVRSSATAEDLPGASFAGQQETFLNVHGDEELLDSSKKCFASLFTDRAIIYRLNKGFDHFQVALSIGVQKMVRSDLASSGVGFSLDTETGFENIIMINASYGLGEAIVKGEVNPDEYRVFKPTLLEGYAPIIRKYLGSKKVKVVYAKDGEKTKTVPVPENEQKKFALNDDEILELARATAIIDQHYTQLNNRWTPMDIEWAKDGNDGKIYIIQARPETVHALKKNHEFFVRYQFKDLISEERNKSLIVEGQSIGQAIAQGKARIVEDIQQIDEFHQGDILVTHMTDPDWVPIMKKAAAIVTNQGGRTCHAAIVSRELGVPAIVGAEGATEKIETGQAITIDSSQGKVGYVYDGLWPYELIELEVKNLPQIPVELMVNIADPDRAINVSFLPEVVGVGLARIEFIITHLVKAHPMAFIDPERIEDKETRKKLDELTYAYPSKESFFVDTLAQGVGTIAAAFYPHPVIVRFSDFKSNEYRNLIGGKYFEPEETNPMLGIRGASRYYSTLYEPAFILECSAMKKVREKMGLTNVRLMIPFVRTVDEAKKVLNIMKENGLGSNKNDLQIFMMAEIPSNALLIDEFCTLFDGFSIGSNDLTQFTLAIDRDSAELAPLFDERNPAVKKLMKMIVEGAIRNKRYSGICGQAPSDYPEIGEFLITLGIDSLSLNPDAVIPFILHYGNNT